MILDWQIARGLKSVLEHECRRNSYCFGINYGCVAYSFNVFGT
jgi:hypothetical protein